jgi:hypothetical protein
MRPSLDSCNVLTSFSNKCQVKMILHVLVQDGKMIRPYKEQRVYSSKLLDLLLNHLCKKSNVFEQISVEHGVAPVLAFPGYR